MNRANYHYLFGGLVCIHLSLSLSLSLCVCACLCLRLSVDVEEEVRMCKLYSVYIQCFKNVAWVFFYNREKHEPTLIIFGALYPGARFTKDLT